jgi:hypothetical protein
VAFLTFGAGNQVRTGDLNLGKVALYQLSYSREGPRFYLVVGLSQGEIAAFY